MKQIQFTIKHDKLRYGSYPVKEINQIDNKVIHVSISKTVQFIEYVLVTFNLNEDDDLHEALYEFGSLVGTIISNRY